MTLLEKEKELDTLAHVVLTNYRIMQERESSYKISIFLEKISSIEAQYKRRLFLLILGIAALVSGPILFAAEGYSDIEWVITLLSVGIAFVVAYFFLGKHTIEISSDGGKSLDIYVKRMLNSRVEEFITNIQKAKLERC